MLSVTINFNLFQAFGAKGFCLSPQMPPDQLASIRTFESDSKSNHLSESKKYNEIEKKSDAEYQQKKKRKLSGNEDSQKNGNEICSEEPKRKKEKHVENENYGAEDEHEGANVIQDENVCTTKEEMENENDSLDQPKNGHNEETKAKSLDDSSIDVPVKKEEKDKLKRKKCHSESSALEDTPKKRKKFKSENDTMDGEENSEEKGGNYYRYRSCLFSV